LESHKKQNNKNILCNAGIKQNELEEGVPLLKEKIKKGSEKYDILRVGLFYLVIGASVSFFKLSAIPRGALIMLEAAIVVLVVLVVLFNRIYWKIPHIKMTFSLPISLIFIAIFLSIFAAYYFHNQSIPLTVWAQRYMFLYFFYYFLHIIKLPLEQIEKLLFYVALGFVALYFLQFVIYPMKIVNVRIDYDRGTIRIFLPGLAFLMLAYYRSLQEFYYRRTMKYAIYVVVFLSIVILLGSRASMAITGFLTAMALVLGKQIKSKILLYILIMFAMVTLYFAFQDIFENILNLTEEQSETAEDNVRLKSIEYFTTDFFPNPMAYVSGNGMHHEASSYGLSVAYMGAVHGYYQSDIGIIGEFSRYGVLLVLGGAIIFLKLIFYKYNNRYIYIRYFILSGTMAISLGMNFTSSYGIVSLCILMYVVDCLKHERSTNQEPKRPHVYFEQLEGKNSVV